MSFFVKSENGIISFNKTVVIIDKLNFNSIMPIWNHIVDKLAIGRLIRQKYDYNLSVVNYLLDKSIFFYYYD